MKRILFYAIVVLLALPMFSAQKDKPAYVIFNAKGQKVSYAKMIASLEEADVLLFGEYHDNPISHWLQLEVTREIGIHRGLVLGAEMFEADNQDALNAYLKGEIDAKGLDSLARLWPNYKTDYAPLVDYAKEKGLAFIATNIPRRYARMVNYNGFEALDTLTALEKSWMAPLPIEFDIQLPMYQKILDMMGEHATPNLVKAQAMKDATMAYFINKNLKEGTLFIHYNGAFHSNGYEGIGWYLNRLKSDQKVVTFSTVSQADLKKLDAENKGLADFIICVDEDMTSTH